MDCQEALEFVDCLVYEQTNKHLNDLERDVFIGSWQGKTYEEIYPLNPEYVEKYVGYKLWQKLSSACGEKVSKKKIKGAIERAIKLSQKPKSSIFKKVFIIHCHPEPDLYLANQLYQEIVAAGHQVFLVNLESDKLINVSSSKDWFFQINLELQQCDYLLLLLSPQAAVSEMVIEMLQRTKQLRESRSNALPVVLPIRLNLPTPIILNHDLQSYLLGTHQKEWLSPADTPALVTDLLTLLNQGEITQQNYIVEEWENPSSSSDLQVDIRTVHELPSPVAEPELPTGQVRLASAFYIERTPYESQCYKEILKPGCLIRIKAPRQMGKTSLMARILYHAKEQGFRTVPLSLQHADASIFTNLKEFLQWFCAKITRKLRLSYKVDDYWSETYGSKDNCTAFFEDCLLPESDAPLVLGLDEVDRVFQYPKIADDFFGLLRAWYEEGGYGYNEGYSWEKLRLVIVHSTEVYIPLYQSPFNVGLPIELTEFSEEQVRDLANRHGLDWQSNEISQLMQMVGGHPYLVRLALYYIAQQELTLSKLVEIAPTDTGIYGDHLRRHLWNLQQYPDLATAFAKVIHHQNSVELDSVLAFQLNSLGLVQLQQDNRVIPRFELYRQYFQERLPVPF